MTLERPTSVLNGYRAGVSANLLCVIVEGVVRKGDRAWHATYFFLERFGLAFPIYAVGVCSWGFLVHPL